MNFSFDWGAVAVSLAGAVISIAVIKNEIKWIVKDLLRVDESATRAHQRLDRLTGGHHSVREDNFA